MRKKTANNLSGIKGRSKIPSVLASWMRKTEHKFGDKIAKVDIEYQEPTTSYSKGALRVIYYSNDEGYWKIIEIGEVEFTLDQADDFFEGKLLPKADLLIKLIEDQKVIKNLLDDIYTEVREDADPDTDAALRVFFQELDDFMDPMDKESLEVDTGIYKQNFRDPNLFAARSGEEDDDYPEFTGHDKLKSYIIDKLKQNNLKFKRLLLNPSEKSWFTVEIHV